MKTTDSTPAGASVFDGAFSWYSRGRKTMIVATEETLRKSLNETTAMMDRQELLKQLWRLTRDGEHQGDRGKTCQTVTVKGERK